MFFKVFTPISLYRAVIIPYDQILSTLKSIQTDPGFKAAWPRSLDVILYDNQMSSVENRLKVCKELLMTYPAVIYTKKNFYLLESINEKLNLLNAAGLIEFWHFQVVDLNFLKVGEEKSNLFCLGLTVALIVFTLEVIGDSKLFNSFLQMKIKLSHKNAHQFVETTNF